MKVILSGSGMRYPAFAGALKCLVDHNIPVDEIAGVSGGAIVSLAFASGYNYKQKNLTQLILETLPGPNNLLDRSYWPFSRKWGLIKGNKLRNKLSEKCRHRFEDMEIPLHVVTVSLPRKKHIIWNGDNAPEANVPKVVRASMAIPFVFDYVPLPNAWHTELANKPGKDEHVDGGTANNFPLDMFGTGRDVIGLKVVSKGAKEEPYKKIGGIKDYIGCTIDTMLRASETEHIEDAMYARVVKLPVTFGGLDFDVDANDAGLMIGEGYKAMREAIINGLLE